MDNKIIPLNLTQVPTQGSINLDNKFDEVKGDNMEILFDELKKDMREREQRMEKRYQEQQELLLNQIDKKLDSSLGDLKSEINKINIEVKNVKNSTTRWGVGLVVSIIIAFIGAFPQLINTIVELLKLIPNP